METVEAANSGTHHQRTASRTRYLWVRKSKSETDKESLQRGRLFSSGAATTSSHTSNESSTSSTAASGALPQRTDTMSSSSSHDITSGVTRQRIASSMPLLVKHVAVQCLLLTDDCRLRSTDNTTTALSDKVSSGVGLCVDMAAVYRGTSHQRRKAIAVTATGDETLLTQRTTNYRSITHSVHSS